MWAVLPVVRFLMRHDAIFPLIHALPHYYQYLTMTGIDNTTYYPVIVGWHTYVRLQSLAKLPGSVRIVRTAAYRCLDM
jgi:hypothetical protein